MLSWYDMHICIPGIYFRSPLIRTLSTRTSTHYYWDYCIGFKHVFPRPTAFLGSSSWEKGPLLILLFDPRWFSVVVEFGPLEERAAFFPRRVACMTHPHVSTTVLFFALDTPQHSGHMTVTSRCIFGVEAFSVVPVSNVNSFVTSNGVGINDVRWMNAMFPFFLHFRMHNETRVVR